MSDRPSKNWTTRQLKNYIRQQTKEINKKYSAYIESVKDIGEINEVLEREHEQLYRLGKAKPDMSKDYGDVSNKKIGVGLTYKKKEELLMQARALDGFNNIDVYTPSYNEMYDEKERNAYNNFIETTGKNYNLNRASFSIEDYHNLVETLGALSDKINNFGYTEVMQLYLDSSANKRIDMLSTIIAVNDEIKGAGYTQQRAVDLLRQRINI